MSGQLFESAATEDLRPGSNPPRPTAAALVLHLLPDMVQSHVAVAGSLPEDLEAALRRMAVWWERFDQVPPASASLVVVGAGGPTFQRNASMYVCRLQGRPDHASVVLCPGSPAAPVEGPALAVPIPEAPRGRRARLRAKITRALQLLKARLRPGAGTAHPSDIRLLSPQRPERRPRGRHAVLEGTDGQLPRYVRDLALSQGVDLQGARWALAPPRGFRSQKVLFVCEASAGEGYVVKMVQEPRFNVRLAREEAALRALAAQPVPGDGRVPRVEFSGLHAGLLVVGETCLNGDPFRRRSKGEDACPFTAAALRWLAELGSATAYRQPGNGAGFAAVLQGLVDRYASAYRPPADELARLGRALECVASAELPAVRSHGDPGAWNLLVDNDGRIGFLDWENSDERGLPLWDTLLFLDGVGRLRADLGGKRYTPARALELFGGRLATTAVANYCSHMEIDEQLWAPLAATCWMYQAVKETTRAPAGRLQDSHSRQVTAALLAHC